MYDLAQELIAALARLRAMLEQPRPIGVLERLVHERRLREVSRSVLDLRVRYMARRGAQDAETAAIIRELGTAIEELRRRRSASADTTPPGPPSG
jgi:hypothetical protein